ncbi:unnamed protein product [Aphanomyces euteiches]|uniref:Transcription elongation factor SPT5 n=1 Tax=Aphanomyces euteiches TaxID=100861 RepID=A0A6G0WWS8_9STRA|nr:hypothetical protein Ae201684_010892 [Aphanomyces euteiches]KAH9061544.1 hypothetical protein Ae201684P_020879 [Aphanomyces euteiches]KAH9127220.1 hypothetical protein AeMF1_002458 [Aphanomyces euteiches]KAH9132207.1 hypothetical protein AeRB84_021333 [Aphanomyces euteiches]KAH9158618.1 hypothetical protein LEN26_002849 [Aphanomyces euteiches]
MSSEDEDMRSDDDEQENIDDYSDEDEEEEVSSKKRKGTAGKKKKPKKPKVMSFIDDMADEASEDESDEDDYPGGGFLDDEGDEAEREKEGLDQRPPRYDRPNRPAYDDDDTEEYIRRLQERAKKQTHRGNDDEDEDNLESVQSAVAQQSLLPSIQDPRLWVFKCKPGREQHLVLALMNKFLEMSKRGQPLHIKSVVASSSKGFIYVESEREPYAKDAINGIRDIFQWSMKLVPIHEMTSVLTIQSKKTPVTAGCWARFKRAGVYKGDLCKVIEVVDNGLRAVVKHIPRLDQAVLNGGEQPKYKKGQRPPLKLFIPNPAHGSAEVTRKRHPLTNEMMDFFDNEWFKDGFLYKELNIATMLQLDEVNPTLDEINKFSHTATEVDSDNEPTSITKLDLGDADAWKNKVDLTKGDTVKVIEGDLINLLGVVVGTNSNNDTVRVMPLHEEIKDTILDFQLKQLIKIVKVGAHIKVVSGRYSGETGTVVSIDESLGAPVAIVLVDTQAKEIQVRVRDIQESAEVSQGLDSLKGKELYDLVALPHGEVGVITRVGRDGFTVLVQSGQTKTIADQEIQRKMFSTRASALDKKGNPITVGEMVQVVDGPYSGESGTIKHIYRSFIFLHNNRVSMNAGIFMVRNRQLVLAGDKMKSKAPAAMGGGPNDRMDRQQRGGPRGFQSDLVGKTVKIKRGQWKGYIGMVVDESDNTVKVEIHCKSKCVEIEKKYVTVAGDRQGVHVDRTHGSSTMNSSTSQTPMVSQTPLHHGMTPMATPLHVPRTPSRSGNYPSGGRTPRDAWSAQNDDMLLEANLPHEKEISHAQSFGTPLEPVVPSEFGVASTYKTSSSSSYSDMNSVLNHPTTPGLLNPTTPGFQGSYSTPGLQPTTPFVSTPGMPRNSVQTPLQTPFQSHSSFGPTTPGINMMHHPTTPGISMNPTTPGFAAYTPMNPTTPGLFAKGTPAATTPHMGVGATPAPMTPAGGQFYESGFGSSSGNNESSWMSKGVVVEVTQSGEYYQAEGVIVTVGQDTCLLDIRGQMVNIHVDGLKHVIPEKNNNVKILVGEEAGKTGSLIGTDPPDGIVKMDSTAEIKIYPLSHLAKLA